MHFLKIIIGLVIFTRECLTLNITVYMLKIPIKTMRNFLQKARLSLISIEYSKYFTIVLIFLILFTASIVIVISQQEQEQKQSKTPTETQVEPLFMVDPGTGTTSGERICSNDCTYSSLTSSKCNGSDVCTTVGSGSGYRCAKKVIPTYGSSYTVYGSVCYSTLGKNPDCETGYSCSSVSNIPYKKCCHYEQTATTCKKTQGSDAYNYCINCNTRAWLKYRCDGTTYEDHRGKDTDCNTSEACTGTVAGICRGVDSCSSIKGCSPANERCIELDPGATHPYECCPGVETGVGISCSGGICKDKNISSCSGSWKTGLCPGPSNVQCCVTGTTGGGGTGGGTTTTTTTIPKKYTCPNPSSCSNKYIGCRPTWTSADSNCSDTWNATYTKDCSCLTNPIGKTATDNCNAKGIDTTSCSIDTSKNTPPPPDEVTPFDCTGTKDGYLYKCDTNCNTTDGWNTSAYNNMTNKTICQKDSKLCCYKGTGTTTNPQTPDCDSEIQYGECTGAPANTCSQDNGTRTITYTALPSGGQCNEYSLYSQACTQNNCSFNYTCNSGSCVAITTTGNTVTTTTTTTGNNYTTTTTRAGSSTTTIPATSTILTFNLGLDGIGSAGDHLNPNTKDSNKSPKRTTRNVIVSVLNSTGTKAEKTINASYSSEIGKLSLNVDLGTSLSTGVYTVKAKTDGYLRKNLSTTQNINAGQTNTLPDTNLIVGDINNDNTISILDYNILISCSIFTKDNNDLCNQNQTNITLSDLDDDGIINQYDYNLFVREFSAQKED